ncbi:TPM domain-containing protein [Novosphingobium sp.]|uniref:TPM domain-containing protein n=1 Tax=Novosphingobium sp. TaxID=1874826 RepID=UPI003BAABDFE
MLTDTDRKDIAEAVAAAEATSAGEIVTIITPQSDSYRDVALAWSIFVAFLALAALELAPTFYLSLIERLLGLWAHEWTPRQVLGIALTAAVIKFLGMLLLMAWRPLRLLLTPAPIKSARVHARALTCFRIGAEGRTTGRTGILIYLSLAEHRAEIIADEAIASKVSPEVWGDAMHALLGPLRAGKVGEGMVAAVRKVGAVLAEHLPRAADDENELPDRVIEV